MAQTQGGRAKNGPPDSFRDPKMAQTSREVSRPIRVTRRRRPNLGGFGCGCGVGPLPLPRPPHTWAVGPCQGFNLPTHRWGHIRFVFLPGSLYGPSWVGLGPLLAHQQCCCYYLFVAVTVTAAARVFFFPLSLNYNQ